MSKKLNESSTNIKALGFDTIWSGAAYDKQKESYDDVIEKLDKCIKEVETFDQATEKLNEYREICERIKTLYGYISSCSSKHTEEQNETGCTNCAVNSYEISQKEVARTNLRKEIIELLSKIVGIDVELEGPTNFNPIVVDEDFLRSNSIESSCSIKS